MILLDGKATAAAIRSELRDKVTLLTSTHGRAPGLAVVLSGDDPASQVYVRMKIKACEETGVVSKAFYPEPGVTQAGLEALIDQLNADPEVDGILVQLPLFRHLDSQRILDRIDPDKDVDGFHPMNVGRLALGLPCFKACTPAGCLELLKRYNIETRGKRCVVVGRSNIVGRPLSIMLGQSGPQGDATVVLCHSRTRDLKAEVLAADIVFAAIGRPRFITGDMVREGAVVVDVGINRTDAGLVGDCDFDAMKDKVAAITPVPGGVGPMTIAMLLMNTVESFERRMGA